MAFEKKYPDFAARMNEAADDMGGVMAHRGRNAEFARRMTRKTGKNVTPDTARRWFEGFAMPRYKRMADISEVLDVSPEWLESGKGEKRGGNVFSDRPRALLASSTGKYVSPRDVEPEKGGQAYLKINYDFKVGDVVMDLKNRSLSMVIQSVYLEPKIEFCETPEPDGCAMNLILMQEDMQDGDSPYLYPVNYERSKFDSEVRSLVPVTVFYDRNKTPYEESCQWLLSVSLDVPGKFFFQPTVEFEGRYIRLSSDQAKEIFSR